ncbi:hypothetical protein APUTEX25_002522, partial [Auxenochlorella protothecoides]
LVGSRCQHGEMALRGARSRAPVPSRQHRGVGGWLAPRLGGGPVPGRAWGIRTVCGPGGAFPGDVACRTAPLVPGGPEIRGHPEEEGWRQAVGPATGPAPGGSARAPPPPAGPPRLPHRAAGAAARGRGAGRRRPSVPGRAGRRSPPERQPGPPARDRVAE